MKTNTKKTQKKAEAKTTGTEADKIQPAKMTDAQAKVYIDSAEGDLKGLALVLSHRNTLIKLFGEGVTYAAMQAVNGRKGIQKAKRETLNKRIEKIRSNFTQDERDAMLETARKATNKPKLTQLELIGIKAKRIQKPNEGKERMRNLAEHLLASLADSLGTSRKDTKTSQGCAIAADSTMAEAYADGIEWSHNGESIQSVVNNDNMTVTARVAEFMSAIKGVANQLDGPLKEEFANIVKEAKEYEAENTAKAKAEADSEAFDAYYDEHLDDTRTLNWLIKKSDLKVAKKAKKPTLAKAVRGSADIKALCIGKSPEAKKFRTSVKKFTSNLTLQK